MLTVKFKVVMCYDGYLLTHMSTKYNLVFHVALITTVLV